MRAHNDLVRSSVRIFRGISRELTLETKCTADQQPGCGACDARTEKVKPDEIEIFDQK